MIDPASWNRYTYVRNNPLRYIDPSGLIWLEAKDGSGYMWVDDKKYKADDYKDKWNEVATGTVISLGGVSGDYSKYQNLVGGYVTLDEGGALNPYTLPTITAEVTINITEQEQIQDNAVRDRITEMIGGSVVEFGKVRNTTGTSYHDAIERLHGVGFEPYWDPHWEHWGGSDQEGQVDGTWYHVTLGYPDRFVVVCGGQCESIQPDPNAPWTFMQIHSHDWAPHNHWLEMLGQTLMDEPIGLFPPYRR